MWRLYGWFTGLMTCGSCVGAVAYAARMMLLVNDFKTYDSSDPTERASLAALSYSFFPAYLVTYAIEFLCMCAALLMVLDRMSVFAAPDAGVHKRWTAVGRIVMAVVVLGNAVGLAANIASAVEYRKAADYMNTASERYAANNTNDGDKFVSLSLESVQLSGSNASVQRFGEVAVLLIVIILFAVVGGLFLRRLSASMSIFDAAARRASVGRTVRLQMTDAAAAGRALRLQMLGTTAFVFVTMLLRSVFSTMLAVALRLRDFGNKCPGTIDRCDASCHNVYTHIAQWMNHTPEFQLVIVLISSPLSQLVALWGMTTKSMLPLMMPSKHEPNEEMDELQTLS